MLGDEVKKQVSLLEVSEADLKELVKDFFFQAKNDEYLKRYLQRNSACEVCPGELSS